MNLLHTTRRDVPVTAIVSERGERGEVLDASRSPCLPDYIKYMCGVKCGDQLITALKGTF